MARTKEPIDWYNVTEVELVYKSKVKASERPAFSNARAVYKFLLKHWDAGKIELREEFKVLYLNRGNKLLHIYDLATGGITGVIADPKLIFAMALKTAACEIILAHNHPSGNLEPSYADKQMTNRLVECGRILEIKVLDHLIISKAGFFSFGDEGML